MNLLEKDKELIWHPFTQMLNSDPVIGITKGKGVHLFNENGDSYIDAISSWWVNIHGHSHPYIAQKIHEQLLTLEHIIFAGFTHPPAVEICSRLSNYFEGAYKFFISDNGSTSVEVAIKMAIQYWNNIDKPKTKVIAFENAYHGDTFGAMSAGARSIFFKAFDPFLFDVIHIPVPTPGNEEECYKKLSETIKQKDVAAFIFEPLVQGAGGMIMYEPEALKKCIQLCQDHEVICIADEVMTGFYRTGTFVATDQTEMQADIYCLSKGLTGGTLPLSLTVCKSFIYDGFLSNDMTKTFYHGHSYTANPIGCAAALASLDLLEGEETQKRIQEINQLHLGFAKEINKLENVANISVRGTIIRFEVMTNEETSYLNPVKKQIVDYCLSKGILIRPLGNVVYILPPYCITNNELEYVYEHLKEVVQGL